MRAYYICIKHLKTTFEEDDDVNTVVTESFLDMDNWRGNLYPIVDINVINEVYLTTTAVTRFNVEITVLTPRDMSNEVTLDKFWRHDNRHDNWNLTHSILKTARVKILKDHLDTEIGLNAATSATRFFAVKENLFDGWQQTWTIDIPDDLTSIC